MRIVLHETEAYKFYDITNTVMKYWKDDGTLLQGVVFTSEVAIR